MTLHNFCKLYIFWSYVLIAIRKYDAKWSSCQTGAVFCFDCINDRKCCFTDVSRPKRLLNMQDIFINMDIFLDKVMSERKARSCTQLSSSNRGYDLLTDVINSFISGKRSKNLLKNLVRSYVSM